MGSEVRAMIALKLRFEICCTSKVLRFFKSFFQSTPATHFSSLPGAERSLIVKIVKTRQYDKFVQFLLKVNFCTNLLRTGEANIPGNNWDSNNLVLEKGNCMQLFCQVHFTVI